MSIQPPLGPLGGNKLLSEPFAYFGVQRSEEYKQIYPNLMIRDCINPSKRFGLKLDKDSFLNEILGSYMNTHVTSQGVIKFVFFLSRWFSKVKKC